MTSQNAIKKESSFPFYITRQGSGRPAETEYKEEEKVLLLHSLVFEHKKPQGWRTPGKRLRH